MTKPTTDSSAKSQPGLIVSKTPVGTSSEKASLSDQNTNILSTDTAKETGLNATANVIRDQSLHPENQKAAHNLVDRMYWSREENVDRTVSVDENGSLEDL